MHNLCSVAIMKIYFVHTYVRTCSSVACTNFICLMSVCKITMYLCNELYFCYLGSITLVKFPLEAAEAQNW